jgi:hypothetical protein
MTEEQAGQLIALMKQLVINVQRPMGARNFICECGVNNYLLRNQPQSIITCHFCGKQEQNPQ